MELESLAMEAGYSLSSQEPAESGLSPTKDDGDHGPRSIIFSLFGIMDFPLDSLFDSEGFSQLVVNFGLSFSDTWGWWHL